ncbi:MULTISPECIES: 4-hydroxythreonine-4-phosphate dehydrogenase PdxA [unclassified Prochlorococcus]|uniref:4-hydroxythreonine-4-phosphate dehydrogenase PdxA n=1 Tax=unclassified Prochlorococcus TaxID=2627481 RepID=UPI00053373CE|nr:MULTISPECIES: 4-hydroxythreonine-4-phosphate dehydrogenase PdxA [unclassified Prochlorococcus]KGG16921.1 4-hydroxythreonine-4-phosphate dehydrogenase [Prochlorococcus sp. MIT 0602]KGG18103.1 4-hydroxythreonine-4-phosphate dehydrogenase [Prochlorococcus sp. MIT 0603]
MIKTKQKKSFDAKKRIVIALGDPVGIGIEVTLKALGSTELPKEMQPVLVGCTKTIKIIYSKLKAQGISNLVSLEKLDIEDIPFDQVLKEGKPSKQSGKISFEWLTKATEIVLEKKARALVTAPIAKHSWQAAGFNYPGQTERLAELAKIKNPSMMFTAKSPHTSWQLNTLLATTHIPLIDVPKSLSPELITSKLDTLLQFCKKFKQSPRLAIAGLNPHAGEEGKLGCEEIKWLIPVIKQWRAKNPEITLIGPVSPDTCWISNAESWNLQINERAPDGILALYHDQGLIPIKIIAFDFAVNTTLGLPFVRTSPDHGTGFDIAGKGVAKSQSMLSAIKAAWELST